MHVVSCARTHAGCCTMMLNCDTVDDIFKHACMRDMHNKPGLQSLHETPGRQNLLVRGA
jgi:hypothetical protein